MYDFIIIGAGISGLYIGSHLKNKKENFLIIEGKTRVGGRIKTINYENHNYEAGAYRFTKKHVRLTKLIHDLNLNKYIQKMDNKKSFFLRNSNKNKLYNTKSSLNYNDIIKKLSKLKNKILINNNILTLVDEYYDNETKNFIKDYCGYDNFIENSTAINLKKHYKSLNSHFYNLTCGFNKITETIFENVKENTIFGEKLIDIEINKNIYQITTNKKKYSCKKIIITIPKENLLEIPFISKNIKFLDSVSSSPYLRIFAVYPKKEGKVWFHDINYTVTDNILRKIIPENYEKGLIQICYNDNKNAEYMRNIISNGELKKFLNENLKKIFPDKIIPEPIFLNCHYWKNGNHFWLPLYDNIKIANYMTNPIENLYIAGESYSDNQAWIEGSLETSEKVIKLLEKKTKKKTLKKKTKIYTVEEVRRHNNKKSAWTILDNKVYNITNLVNNFRHPGGNIIEIAMGKDITEIFNSIGHSNFSRNLLKKFYIGNLVS
jgi:protoporphyrinogen oxidase